MKTVWFAGRMMKFIILTVLSIVQLAILPAESQAESSNLKVFPGEYVVTLPQAAKAGSVVTSRALNLGASVIESLDNGTLLVAPKSNVATARALRGDKEAVNFDGDESFCKELINSGKVASCSPNFELHTFATPNDPKFGSLYGLSSANGIDAPRAWDVTTGSDNVVVAVIDTGVDYNHDDLSANIWTNPGEIPGDGIDNDNNGVIDDVHGFNAINGSGDPMDDNLHGTHVSGTIGAVGNNGKGVTGINWHVKIMGLKFLSSNGSGSLSDAIKAIDYMVKMKSRFGINIRVANNSWGGGGHSEPLKQAIVRARDAGIIFAAAAGNESNNNDENLSYPASYDVANVVSVAAIDQNGNLASFSNYGATQVDIAAPGVGILSTAPGGGYQSLSGTSMATPHVTGALALLFAADPALDMASAINRLYDSGTPSSTLSGVVRTGRKLNVARMVANENSPLPAPTPEPASCHYSMQKIAFEPDTSADAEQVVLSGDEGEFYSLALPFEMPFFRSKVSSASVSLNGVIYMDHAPGEYDFKNDAQAPLNSFAALHSDLSALDSGFGVRVKSSDDKVVIFWKMKTFGLSSAGDILVRTVLHNDGVIDDYIDFTDEVTQLISQGAATIGISGPSSSSSDTYAYNNNKIKAGLGVRFVPNCDGNVGTQPDNGVAVEQILLTNPGKIRSINPGARIGITLKGHGTGTVELRANVDGFECNDYATVGFNNGSAKLRTVVPASIRRSLKFTSGDASRKLSINGFAKGRTIAARKAQQACGGLFRNMKRR